MLPIASKLVEPGVEVGPLSIVEVGKLSPIGFMLDPMGVILGPIGLMLDPLRLLPITQLLHAYLHSGNPVAEGAHVLFISLLSASSPRVTRPGFVGIMKRDLFLIIFIVRLLDHHVLGDLHVLLLNIRSRAPIMELPECVGCYNSLVGGRVHFPVCREIRPIDIGVHGVREEKVIPHPLQEKGTAPPIHSNVAHSLEESDDYQGGPDVWLQVPHTHSHMACNRSHHSSSTNSTLRHLRSPLYVLDHEVSHIDRFLVHETPK